MDSLAVDNHNDNSFRLDGIAFHQALTDEIHRVRPSEPHDLDTFPILLRFKTKLLRMNHPCHNGNPGNKNGNQDANPGHRVLCTAGNQVSDLNFNNKAKHYDWMESLQVLKDENDDIHELDQSEKTATLHQWISNVMSFRDQWGNGFVPQDVKDAVHDVQNGLGIPLTVWN